MAVPKRRMSRANTRSRRAQWKAQAPTLAPITINGVTYQVPKRLHTAIRRGVLDPEKL